MTSPPWTPSTRQYRWMVLVALVPFLAIVVARWTDPPSAVEGDYAQYLLHAKAIAESRPYGDIGYIYTDLNLVGPRLQPPGWPIVLAPLVAVFGTHSPAFKVLVTLLVAAFAVVAAYSFARRGELIAGIALMVVLPVAMESGYATSAPLSDPLFCVLVWLTILVADSEGPLTWRRGLALTMLCVACLSVRVAGIALAPAMILYGLLRWREGGVKIVVPVTAMFVVSALGAFLAPDVVPFLERAVNRMSIGIQNVSTYRYAFTSGTLYPFPWNGVNDVYHALAVIPLVSGAIVLARKYMRSALTCFVVCYVGLLIVSPVRDPRYAWPLLPLLPVCLATGLTWLGTRLLPRGVTPQVPRFVLVILGVLTLGAVRELAKLPPRESLTGDRDTMALFDWLREMRDTTDLRVVFTNPRVLTLETEVPAMGIPVANAPMVVAEFERKAITHVIVQRTRITRLGERNLIALVNARESQFPAVYTNDAYSVRRFVAHPPAADTSVQSPPLK